MYAKEFKLYPVSPYVHYVGATSLKKRYLGSEYISFVVKNLSIFLPFIYMDIPIETGRTVNNFDD